MNLILIWLILIVLLVSVVYVYTVTQSPQPYMNNENEKPYISYINVEEAPIFTPMSTLTPPSTLTQTSTPPQQQDCVSMINKFRSTLNLKPLVAATQEQIDCANRSAINDAKSSYHDSVKKGMCSISSQCECRKGVRGKDATATGLQACINAYIDEGPPGTVGLFPETNHGHYKIITGDFKSVACGTDGNGFFTHNFFR